MCRAEFEGYSDDETVRVVMSGNQEPKSVDITEAAIEQGADVSFFAGCTHAADHCTHCDYDCAHLQLQKLSELVTAAMREAHGKSVTVSWLTLFAFQRIDLNKILFASLCRA